MAVRWLDWLWVDPLLSLLISLLLLRSALRLVRRAAHILLEGVPEGLDSAVLAAVLRGLDPAIEEVHHLHLWQLAAGQRMATLHVRVRGVADAERVLRLVHGALAERFGIRHATVQIERDDCASADCHAHT